MEGNKLTHEMKRHAVIVAIHANHSDLEISEFLNLARLFVHKVRRELEVSNGKVFKVLPSAKHIKHVQTQLEHYSLCSKSRALLPPKSHNPKHVAT